MLEQSPRLSLVAPVQERSPNPRIPYEEAVIDTRIANPDVVYDPITARLAVEAVSFESIAEVTPSSLRGRVKRMLGRAAEHLLYYEGGDIIVGNLRKANTGIRNGASKIKRTANSAQNGLQAFAGQAMIGNVKDSLKGYYTDETLGKRRKVVSVVAGAAALAGLGVAVYLETKGAGVSQHANVHHAGSHQDNLLHVQDPFQHASHEQQYAHELATTHNHHSLIRELPKYNANTGAGTIDHLVLNQAHALGYRMSDTDPGLHRLVSETLQRNGVSWREARQLSTGFRVHMLHPEQIEQLLKNQ